MEAERRAVWTARFMEPVDPDQVTVLAEAILRPGAEGPLGFCCILSGQDPVWGSLIDNLHVRPGLSRRRLGRWLLREAAVLVPDRHAATPMHLTVLEENARAIGAYESWGGDLVERLLTLESEGQRLPIRRYAWRSPAALVERLDARS